MTEPDVLLCNILTHELEIDADRVVVYDENFDPPKDDLLYIVVSTRKGKPLSVINDFDSDTNEEVSTVVSYDSLDIDFTSKNRDAIERKEEVLMALTSMYSIEQQILNSVKIFRNGDILDLSFIETASALKRFRIPVIIANVKEKRKAAAYFDKFRTQGAIQE
jgi:hypothetical protein